MALNAPVVSWYNVDFQTPSNSNTVQIAQPYDFGVVDAGYVPTPDDYYGFLIWNNRGNESENAPMMEDVTIGVKDMQGGNGNIVGQEVWAINGDPKWFWAKVDSLGETDGNFAQIGGDLTKPIGTNGSTTHPKENIAVQWTASTSFNVGDFVKPTSDNGFMYEVVSAGTTDTTEPTWSTEESGIVGDGTVEYKATRIVKTPAENNIILGSVNDGSMANAGANFSQVSLKVEVPLDARAGRQNFKLRVSYRYV